MGLGRNSGGALGLWSGPRDPRSGRGGGGPQGLWSGGKPWVGPPQSGRGGVKSSQDNSTCNREGGGGSNCLRTTRPPTEGAGELSNGRTTRLQTEWEGDSSCHRRNRTPERKREPGETKHWEPSQRPTADGERGRLGAGGKRQKPTHCPRNQGARDRWW